MREWTTIPFAIGLTVLVTVAAFAQNSKWAEPYEKALKAIDARQYSAAIPLLEQAVAADSRSAASKYVEGVFRVDYFPFYYLGVAYLEVRNYDKAQENFNKARNGLPRPLLAKLDDYQKRLTTETSAARNTPPPEPIKPPAAPPPPAVNPNFEPTVRQADAALGAKRFADAVSAYDAAKAADAAAFGKQNLQPKRDEAARGVAGQQQAEEGRQLLQNSQLRAARAKFQQADQTLPGQKVVADGLATIRQREDNYQSFKSAAEQDLRANSFQPALDRLAQAKSANPEQYAADNLDARVRTANDKLREMTSARETAAREAAATEASAKEAAAKEAAAKEAAAREVAAREAATKDSRALLDKAKLLASQGKYADAEEGFSAALSKDPANQDADTALKNSRRFVVLGAEAADLVRRGKAADAQQRFGEARSLDPTRFDREGLAVSLDRLIRQSGQDVDKIALRDALSALFHGEASKSIAILEPALAARPSGTSEAAAGLHAYLGVAYATQALSAPKETDASRALRAKALEQFRLALASHRDYRLSSRVVSPKIVALFETAR